MDESGLLFRDGEVPTSVSLDYSLPTASEQATHTHGSTKSTHPYMNT